MTQTDEKPVHVVVADDEEIVLSLVRDMLEDEGHLVQVASNGPDALKLVEETPVDLIITDIRMPHMNGIELAAKAREVRPDVVVIFITGYADLNSAKDAIKQGAFEYILKPFELKEIRQAVDKAVLKIRQLAADKDGGVQLERLSDLSQMLYTAGDRKSLTTLSLKFAMVHCRSTHGVALYWDSLGADCRRVSIVDDQTEETTLADQPLTACLSAIDPELLEAPFYVNDIHQHPLYLACPDPSLVEYLFPPCLEPTHRVVTVPLSRAGSHYGLLMIGLNQESDTLKETDLTFLSITASQLALSLENITLLEEAKDAYARLKELQDETIQLEKMATRGEMSAEIGHELNNFLGVVTGNLSLLDFHLKKQNYDELPRYLHAILDNIDKIKTFTGNLMDLTPIASKKEAIRFDQLLMEVVDYLKPQKRFAGVSLNIAALKDPILFEADATHIQQLLYNLFNNAADATIECARREINVGITIDRAHGMFAMTISDSGAGMEPALLEKAFAEKFTTKKDGHGFGLLVCKRIIENHGGKLSIESALSQGTSITTTFPLADICVDTPVSA
ncbi:MAG: response regulator [candidate division Zixibacteria bacterium]|nr:response regulator [candidate division Zixibacteria bacterium]MDH3938773.1 response regulator [candidate division Zixibacteria bacterium]MDH4034007.1 response regulator [candidate division Zixibacteria bacterium]